MRIRHKDIPATAFIEQPEPKPFKIKGYTKMNQADKVRALLKLAPDELDAFLKTMGAKKTRKGTSVGIKTLDNEVMWHVFAVFIKLRDVDETGYGVCVTCAEQRHWKGFHAGHYMSRGDFCTKYHEQNCHAQHTGCNADHYTSGKQAIHGLVIDEKYGEGTAKMLVKKSQETCKQTPWFFYEQIPIYLSKIKNLPNFKLL